MNEYEYEYEYERGEQNVKEKCAQLTDKLYYSKTRFSY